MLTGVPALGRPPRSPALWKNAGAHGTVKAAVVSRPTVALAQAEASVFDLFELAFSPVGLGAALLLALPFVMLWAQELSESGPSQKSVAAQRDPASPAASEQRTVQPTAAQEQLLPPPASPEAIYLEMRLRLAKQAALEDASAVGTRFVIRFSGAVDAYYENPVRGGTFKLAAGGVLP